MGLQEQEGDLAATMYTGAIPCQAQLTGVSDAGIVQETFNLHRVATSPICIRE